MNSDISKLVSSDINLVRRESETSKKRVKILRIISIILAGFVVIISIVLFIINKGSSLDSIKIQQNAVLTNLTFLNEKGAKLNLLSDRLRNIERIVGIRKNYIKSVTSIIDELPSDAQASSIALDKDGILLTVSSNSLLSINKFLNSVIAISEEKHLIKDLTIESLTVGTTGIKYSLSLKAKFL